MGVLASRAAMSVSGAPGTGAITLGNAVAGCQTFAAAAVPDGSLVSYVVNDGSPLGSSWEIGLGTYHASAGTLTRTTVIATSSGSAAAIALTAAAQVDISPLASDFAPIRGAISGLITSTTSTPASPTTILGVASGAACSDDGSAVITLTAALTKNVAAAWAAGNNNGALDTGSIAASRLYYVFLVKSFVTGATDVLTSLGLTPAMPSGYANSRRIGSFQTDANAQIVAFTQRGDYFSLAAPYLAIGLNNLGTAPTLYVLLVPPNAIARLRGIGYNNSAAIYILIACPDETSAAASVAGNATQITYTSGAANGFDMPVQTNGSGQVAVSASTAGSVLYVDLAGWTDLRGRLS